ncbi:hypothetical protein T06_1488 [Trichinella sp. T6]|nr:hypothetical protein T06_1488 [Trichinella sp. T6]
MEMKIDSNLSVHERTSRFRSDVKIEIHYKDPQVRTKDFSTYVLNVRLYFFMISIPENNFYHCYLLYCTKVTLYQMG